MFIATILATGRTRAFRTRAVRDEWARVQCMVYDSVVVRDYT